MNKCKILHAIPPAIFVIVSYLLFTNLYLTVIIALLVGTFKELYIKSDHGRFSTTSVIADIIGCLIGVLIVWGLFNEKSC